MWNPRKEPPFPRLASSGAAAATAGWERELRCSRLPSSPSHPFTSDFFLHGVPEFWHILTHTHMEVSLMGYPQIIQSNRILPYKPTLLGHPHVWKPPSVSTCILDYLSPELTAMSLYGKISEWILPYIFFDHISIILSRIYSHLCHWNDHIPWYSPDFPCWISIAQRRNVPGRPRCEIDGSPYRSRPAMAVERWSGERLVWK